MALTGVYTLLASPPCPLLSGFTWSFLGFNILHLNRTSLDILIGSSGVGSFPFLSLILSLMGASLDLPLLLERLVTLSLGTLLKRTLIFLLIRSWASNLTLAEWETSREELCTEPSSLIEERSLSSFSK